MPGPLPGWLVAHNGESAVELINHARTMSYLMNSTDTIPGLDLCSILELGGCPSYAYLPYALDEADEVVIGEYDCDSWQLLEFSAPELDPAPWYNANYPESADGIGYVVEEWTGLGSVHVGRPSTSTAAKGVMFGPAFGGGRVMKLNIFILGLSEEAVQYMFDWLNQQLINTCASCATDSLLYRRVCGDEADPGRGVGEFRRVGLTEGLSWESDIGAHRSKCFIRRASFSVTAGDPAIYMPNVAVDEHVDNYFADLPTCLDDAAALDNVSVDRFPCRPSCSELTADCRTSVTFETDALGVVGPVVFLDNDNAAVSAPMRVILYADPHSVGTDSPNPCGLPMIAEIYVRPMPAYSHLIWDVTGRQILYRSAATGTYVESSAYIEANDPPIPRYAPLPCGVAHIVIEPGSFCAEEDGGLWTWPTWDVALATPHFPDVTVQISEKLGAP